jgi:hypothetical protein
VADPASSLRLLASRLSGGYTARVTPVPIPNTEVKPRRADDTARASVWERRSPPGLNYKAALHETRAAFFYFWARKFPDSRHCTAVAGQRLRRNPTLPDENSFTKSLNRRKYELHGAFPLKKSSKSTIDRLYPSG